MLQQRVITAKQLQVNGIPEFQPSHRGHDFEIGDKTEKIISKQ
jgi:hypothetical protein